MAVQFDSSLVTQIQQSNDIVDIVSEHLNLINKGKDMVGLCPFHDDHKQSFSVDDRGNYWRCFAACKGNTIIDFQMKWRELHGQDSSFTATITELAQLLL
mgnify:CR=1 FL=1